MFRDAPQSATMQEAGHDLLFSDVPQCAMQELGNICLMKCKLDIALESKACVSIVCDSTDGHGRAQLRIAQHSMAWLSTRQHAQRSTAQHSMAQHSTSNLLGMALVVVTQKPIGERITCMKNSSSSRVAQRLWVLGAAARCPMSAHFTNICNTTTAYSRLCWHLRSQWQGMA